MAARHQAQEGRPGRGHPTPRVVDTEELQAPRLKANQGRAEGALPVKEGPEGRPEDSPLPGRQVLWVGFPPHEEEGHRPIEGQVPHQLLRTEDAQGQGLFPGARLAGVTATTRKASLADPLPYTAAYRSLKPGRRDVFQALFLVHPLVIPDLTEQVR